MSVISIKQLKKYYGIHCGVENVTFDVDEGEILGFIGPNGAGKSTTIKLLLSLLRPDFGSAEIFGMDTRKDSAKIKENLGYVPGDVRYYPDMKVAELIDTTLRFHHKKPADFRKARTDICDLFDIDLSKKFEELSLGNKKKVAIAQAIIHSPKLIILDEPTNGLDPLIQKYLFEHLQKMNREGTTVLFSSHNLSEVETNCGRAAFIKDGQIIDIEDLTSNGHCAKEIYISVAPGKKIVLPAKLSGASLLRTLPDGRITFQYKGDFSDLLAFLAELSPIDVTIENANLESRFLSYYEGGHKA